MRSDTAGRELVLAALARRFTMLVAVFRAGLPDPAGETIERRLERLAESLYGFQTSALPLLGKLVAQPSLLYSFVQDIHHREQPFGGRQIRDAVVEYLEEEARRGCIFADDAGAAADLLIGSVGLLALTGIVEAREHRYRKRRLAAVVQILIRGLDPHNTRSAR